MAKSYVGIVSRWGLELFCPEVEHAAKFIRQYLQRCQRRAYGVWFVLDAIAAEWLHELTMTGELDAAWSLVEQHAQDGGVFSASHDFRGEAPIAP